MLLFPSIKCTRLTYPYLMLFLQNVPPFVSHWFLFLMHVALQQNIMIKMQNVSYPKAYFTCLYWLAITTAILMLQSNYLWKHQLKLSKNTIFRFPFLVKLENVIGIFTCFTLVESTNLFVKTESTSCRFWFGWGIKDLRITIRSYRKILTKQHCPWIKFQLLWIKSFIMKK